MQDYIPPVVENMVKSTEVEETTVDTNTDVSIGLTEQEVKVTSNSELSAFYFAAVDEVFKYNDGTRSYRTHEDRLTAQKVFIDLTGRTLNYDYPVFEECALYLIKAIQNSPELLTGRLLRHMSGIEKTNYPKAGVENYRLYFNYLMRLAKGWNQRSKIAKLGDIASLTRNFTTNGKSNLEIFMRRLISFKL